MTDMPAISLHVDAAETCQPAAEVEIVPVVVAANENIGPLPAATDPRLTDPRLTDPRLTDPRLHDKLAALRKARIYEPLPLRYQAPLRAMRQLLLRSRKERR